MLQSLYHCKYSRAIPPLQLNTPTQLNSIVCYKLSPFGLPMSINNYNVESQPFLPFSSPVERFPLYATMLSLTNLSDANPPPATSHKATTTKKQSHHHLTTQCRPPPPSLSPCCSSLHTPKTADSQEVCVTSRAST